MDELKAKVSADISGFSSGMNAAAASTQTLKTATEQLKTAKQSLAEAEQAFGAAAAQGSKQAQEVLADYSREVMQAQAKVEALSEALRRNTVAFRDNSGAAGVASSEMRVLSGSMMGSARAAGNFLAVIPGMTTAMNVAFPLFGAIGLIAVLDQAAHAVGDLTQAFVRLGGAETDASTKAILAGDRIIKAAASSRTDSFARFLMGMPQSQNELDVQNAQTAIKQIGYQRQLADIAAQNAEAGKTGAALQRQKTIDLEKEAGFAKESAAQAQKLIDGYQTMLSATKTTRERSWWGLAGETNVNRVISDPNQIKAIQDQMRVAAQAKEQFEQDAKVAVAKIPGAQQHEGIDAAKEAAKAAAALARQSTVVRDAINQQEVAERFLTQAHEALERTWEEGQKADEEATAKAERAEKQREEQWKKAHEEKLAAIRKETEETIRQADIALRSQENTISVNERTGKITRSQGAGASAAAVTTAEQTQTGALRAEQANYNPAYGPQEAAKYQQLQDQITDIEEKAALKREQIAEAEAQRKEQLNTQMFDRMYGPLQTFTDHWLTSGYRMGAAFAKLGDDYAMSMINALMKIGAQELIGLALHTTVGDMQRLDDAKTAAAGAYAATAGVPFIGPVLAPAAAAAAFAAVAAFDVGADSIPKTGLAMVHRNERIIPGPQNERITRALERGSGNGGNENHFHYSPQIQGIDGASVASMARSHGSVFMRQAAQMMRVKGLTQ